MTITETSEIILARLKEISGAKTIDDWGGEIDDLVKHHHALPGLFLAYGGARFLAKGAIGSNQAEHADSWIVVVTAKDLRGKGAAAVACYELIEAVRAKLIGFNIGDSWLWPGTESLLASNGSLMAFALEYTTDTETED